MQGPEARTRRLNRDLQFFYLGLCVKTVKTDRKAHAGVQSYLGTKLIHPTLTLTICTLTASALPTPWPETSHVVECGLFLPHLCPHLPTSLFPVPTEQSRQLPKLERSMGGVPLTDLCGSGHLQLCLRHMSLHVTTCHLKRNLPCTLGKVWVLFFLSLFSL